MTWQNMSHYPRLVLAFILMMTIGAVSAAPPQVLSVTATCRDNEKRIFDNFGMVIDLTLTNKSEHNHVAPDYWT
jgi:hypothetical protein